MTVADVRKYKDNLYAALSRDLSDFEKNFLFIAAGILTFSITFIKDIVKVDQAGFLVCLFIGWFLFAASVGLMMLTLIRSAYASDEIWFQIDAYLIGKGKVEDEDTLDAAEVREIKNQSNTILIRRKSQLRNMRNGAISCLLTGLVCFGFFVAINLWQENHAAAAEKPAATSRSFPLKDLTLKVSDSAIIFEKQNK
ncbi:MAG TPA: hypothetical protein VK563_05530 [Puia sp.]|nr:hypothetical protein [Puia sp.]